MVVDRLGDWVKSVGHFIDGDEVASSSVRTFESVDPATGAAIARVAFGAPDDVDRAVRAARRAYDAGDWANAAPGVRSQVLRRLADHIRSNAEEIGYVESRDTGKPIAQAIAEAASAADSVAYFAGHSELPLGRTYPTDSGYIAYSTRVPYGVVGAVAPWNDPFVLACWKTVPAMAMGNSVVLKMAEQSPLSSSILARLTRESGVPDGVFNLVHGDGPTTGAALVAHPDVPKLTFTGSTETGQAILRSAADHIKSVHLELGGKTPNIIFDDADVDQAVRGSIFTAFYNSGQICTSGSRLLVQRAMASRVIEALVDRAARICTGDPMDPSTQLGPLISREQHERVLGYIERARYAGARVALGGGRPAHVHPGGFFVEPTIFVDVAPAMQIAQEEVFGPVLSILTFDDEDDAVQIANDVIYGLAATVWTNDLGRAFRMAQRIDAGIIWTNSPHYLPLNVPYEGHKMSGLGEDLGIEAAATFTRLKTHVVGFENQLAPEARALVGP